MSISDEGKNSHLERASSLIDSIDHADLILLPEIWNIGYFAFDSYQKESEDLEGGTVALLQEKAVKKTAFIFGGSFIKRSAGKLYNTCILISPKGEILAQYSKIHLFGFNSEETILLTRGTELSVVKTEIGTFGLSVCYDLRFPEMYRKMADLGAEMFLVASAWPLPRIEAWLMLNRVRALENQVFLVSSNCSGSSKGKQFIGHSMVIDPWGTPLASSGFEECVVEAKVDLQKVNEIRKLFPAFTDRVSL
jgi:predicted amidohydrolase